MITYKCATTKIELEQILFLQKANLPQNISSEEMKTQGFVSVHHNLILLKRMNESVPHIIAKDNDKVIGYVLCMHPHFAKEIELLKPMFKHIDCTHIRKSNYIVMGQVCIDKAYRKQGIFRKLYAKMKSSTVIKFPTIITEVDITNTRSLEAHYAIGFQSLITYKTEHHQWDVIYWK